MPGKLPRLDKFHYKYVVMFLLLSSKGSHDCKFAKMTYLKSQLDRYKRLRRRGGELMGLVELSLFFSRVRELY